MADLGGGHLYVLGRIHGVPRAGLAAHIRRTGGSLEKRLGRRTTLAVISHSTAATLMSSGRVMRFFENAPGDTAIISELTFKRQIGLAPPAIQEPRTLTLLDVERLSGISSDLLFWLALYDVIEPVEERYSYRDVVSAREVARLIGEGNDFARIIAAAVDLRREGARLSEVRLTAASHGGLMRSLDGRAVEIDGQYPLELEDESVDVDEVLGWAEEAHCEGEFADAERFYRLAMTLDRMNPVIPFNLASVMDAQGRGAEAAIFWQVALDREPCFPEAWFNLALCAEEAKRHDDAAGFYRTALDLDGDYADAAFNLAHLLYERGLFAEAVPCWERFLATGPAGEDGRSARMHLAECRLRARGAALGA
jgi:tetratricopeptide (TPR) repeat protein